MKKRITVYCIKYGKAPKAFIAIADNSIPFKTLRFYSDIEESLFFEEFIDSTKIPIIKKVCKDSGKSAILLRNQRNKNLSNIINEILGNEVTLKQYSFTQWNNFICGIEEFSSEDSSVIEIDHPINLNDKMLISIINQGLKSIDKKRKDLDKIRADIKKHKRKKKDGK